MKKILLTALVLSSLVSCNLDREPYDGAITDQVVVTETGLEQFLNGIYSKLSYGATDYVGNSASLNLYRAGIFGADEIHMSSASSDDLSQFYNYLRNASGARSNAVWNDGLQAVNATNAIFENLKEGKSAALDHMLGEAYYLRAFSNFAMLQLYSFPYSQGQSNLGIPLKKTSSIDERPVRSTVGESYNAVVEDLLKAETLMAGDSKNNIKGTQAAAQALLARVYLYMENNDKALEYANKVIGSGRYTLLSKEALPTYAQATPENNAETIFAFRVENKPGQYAAGSMLGSMFAVIDNAGWGEMYAASTYLQTVKRFPQDVRNQFITPDYTLDKAGKKTPVVYWTVFNAKANRYEYAFYNATLDAAGKYVSFVKDGTTYPIVEEPSVYGGANYMRYYATIGGVKQYLSQDYALNNRGGFPKFYINKVSYQEKIGHLFSPIISRLGELYLIRAEVAAKKNDVATALAQINIIRKRAGAPEYTSVPTGKTILDLVLEERWVELSFEGHRKFDLLRNKKSIDRSFAGISLSKFTINPGDPETIQFVPQREVTLQPELQQND